VEILQPLQHRRDAADGVVALTFDDGPSDWTDPVLDLLAAHDSHGTFFVIGEAICSAEREQSLRRIVGDGGEVGNHTFTHPQNVGELSAAALREELRATTNRIESVTGVAPRFWRAPHFRSNLKARVVAAGLGLREAAASVIPEDYVWRAERTADFVLRSLQRGDVVDLHDGRPRDEAAGGTAADREETVRALELILEGMAARGLRSVAISKLG
jgi:peptidoglycan/xylan/chitin deacetylase (PgdA/CDA1 family)